MVSPSPSKSPCQSVFHAATPVTFPKHRNACNSSLTQSSVPQNGNQIPEHGISTCPQTLFPFQHPLYSLTHFLCQPKSGYTNLCQCSRAFAWDSSSTSSTHPQSRSDLVKSFPALKIPLKCHLLHEDSLIPSLQAEQICPYLGVFTTLKFFSLVRIVEFIHPSSINPGQCCVQSKHSGKYLLNK